MELSKKQIDDVLCVIRHSRVDIGFGSGGTFGDGENIDKREASKAERGIEIIKRLILSN